MSDQLAAQHAIWTDRLSEYIDGDLTAAEQVACEAHIAACDECRETVASLSRVVARIRTATDRAPVRDQWPMIARQIAVTRTERRRVSFTVPQLLAASIAVALMGGGVTMMVRRAESRAPQVAITDQAPAHPNTPATIQTVGMASRPTYDESITELRHVLAGHRGTMDTLTVRVLERNLAIIDTAISQAQRAVAADPNDHYLSTHLAHARARKITLLRQAALLAAAS